MATTQPPLGEIQDMYLKDFIGRAVIELKPMEFSVTGKVKLNIDRLLNEVGTYLKALNPDVEEVEIYIGDNVYKATEKTEIVHTKVSRGFSQ